MNYTIDKIKDLCKEYCGRCGVEFTGQVEINSRLSASLGRCHCVEIDAGNYYPEKIDFSKSLIENGTDEMINDTIMHECAHYVTCKVTKKPHGHDIIFKSYCDMIAGANSRNINTAYVRGDLNYNKNFNIPEDKSFKYAIYCEKCGQYLESRSRACEVTKEPHKFRSACCNSTIRIKQNW